MYPNPQARLPTRYRPEEVSRFLQWGRKYTKAPTLTPARVEPYAATWKRWWETLQPEWREVGETFIEGTDVSDNDWGVLLSGGNNGLYIVVISLGWWLAAVSKDKDKNPNEWKDIEDVLADVAWVFDGVLSHAQKVTSRTSRKRSAVDVPSHAPKVKRSRRV